MKLGVLMTLSWRTEKTKDQWIVGGFEETTISFTQRWEASNAAVTASYLIASEIALASKPTVRGSLSKLAC